MKIRFVGLPVFVSGARPPVGVVVGWRSSTGTDTELLVCPADAPALVRRISGPRVLWAGRAGVTLDLDHDRFRRAPLYFGDPARELSLRG